MIHETYIYGISMWSVDDLVKALGITGVTNSQVSTGLRRLHLLR